MDVEEANSACGYCSVVFSNLAILRKAAKCGGHGAIKSSNQGCQETAEELYIKELEAKLKLHDDLESVSALARSSVLTDPLDSDIAMSTNYKIAYVSDAGSASEARHVDYKKACAEMRDRIHRLVETNEMYYARLSFAEKVLKIKSDILESQRFALDAVSPDLHDAVVKFISAVDGKASETANFQEHSSSCLVQLQSEVAEPLKSIHRRVSNLHTDYDLLCVQWKSARARMKAAVDLIEASRTCAEDQIDNKIHEALTTLREATDAPSFPSAGSVVNYPDLRLSLPSTSSDDDLVTCPSELAAETSEDVITCLNQVRDLLSKIVRGRHFSDEELRSTEGLCSEVVWLAEKVSDKVPGEANIPRLSVTNSSSSTSIDEGVHSARPDTVPSSSSVESSPSKLSELQRKLAVYRTRHHAVLKQLRALRDVDTGQVRDHAEALLQQMESMNVSVIPEEGVHDDLLQDNNKLLRQRSAFLGVQDEVDAHWREEVTRLEAEVARLRAQLAKTSSHSSGRKSCSPRQRTRQRSSSETSNDVAELTDHDDDSFVISDVRSTTVAEHEPAEVGSKTTKDLDAVDAQLETDGVVNKLPPLRAVVCGKRRRSYPFMTHHRSSLCAEPCSPSTMDDGVLCELAELKIRLGERGVEVQDLREQVASLKAGKEAKEAAIEDLLHSHDEEIAALDEELKKWQRVAASKLVDFSPQNDDISKQQSKAQSAPDLDISATSAEDESSMGSRQVPQLLGHDESLEWYDLFQCLRSSRRQEAELTSTLNESKMEMDAVQKALLDAVKDKSDLEEEIVQLNRFHEQALAQMKQHADVANGELQAVMGERDALKRAFGELKARMEKQQEENVEFSEALESLRSEKAALKCRLDELRCMQAAAAQTSPRPFGAKADAVQVEIEGLKRTAEDRAREISSLRGLLAKANNELAEAERDIERSRAHQNFKEDALLADVRQLREEVALLRELSASNQDASNWRKKCDDVMAQLELAQRDLADLEHRTESDLAEERRKCSRVEAELNQKLKCMEDKTNRIEDDRKLLTVEIQKLQEKLEADLRTFEEYKADANLQFTYMVRDYEERLADYQGFFAHFSDTGSSGPKERVSSPRLNKSLSSLTHFGNLVAKPDKNRELCWNETAFAQLPSNIKVLLQQLKYEQKYATLSLLKAVFAEGNMKKNSLGSEADLKIGYQLNRHSAASNERLLAQNVHLLDEMTAENERILMSKSGGSCPRLSAPSARAPANFRPSAQSSPRSSVLGEANGQRADLRASTLSLISTRSEPMSGAFTEFSTSIIDSRGQEGVRRSLRHNSGNNATVMFDPKAFRRLPNNLQEMLQNLQRENSSILDLLEQTLCSRSGLLEQTTAVAVKTCDSSCQTDRATPAPIDPTASALKSKLFGTEAALSRARTDLALVQGELTAGKRDAEVYRGKIEMLHKAARNTLEMQEREITELRTHSDELQRKLTLLRSECSSENEHLMDQLRRSTSDVETLTLKLRQAEVGAQADRVYIAEVTAQNDILSQELQRIELTMDEWNRSHLKSCRTCRQLQRRTRDLVGQKRYLCQQLAQKQQTLRESLHILARMGANEAITVVCRARGEWTLKGVAWALIAARRLNNRV